MQDRKGFGVRAVDTFLFILLGILLLFFLQSQEPISFSSPLFFFLLLAPILRSIIFLFFLPAPSSPTSAPNLSPSLPFPPHFKLFLDYPLLVLYFYLISLCYGAPFSSPRTFLFAAYLASFLAPLTPFIGSSPLSLIRALASFPSLPNQHKSLPYPLLHFAHTATGALMGTWIGALPIPLDWDRWWQAWPISCVFGCLICAWIASFVSCCAAWGAMKIHDR